MAFSKSFGDNLLGGMLGGFFSSGVISPPSSGTTNSPMAASTFDGEPLDSPEVRKKYERFLNAGGQASGYYDAVTMTRRIMSDPGKSPFAGTSNVSSGAAGMSSAKAYRDIGSPQARMDMIRMRLGAEIRADSVATLRSGGKIFVVVASKGNTAMLEDDENLFPSDAIITALRLISE